MKKQPNIDCDPNTLKHKGCIMINNIEIREFIIIDHNENSCKHGYTAFKAAILNIDPGFIGNSSYTTFSNADKLVILKHALKYCIN